MRTCTSRFAIISLSLVTLEFDGRIRPFWTSDDLNLEYKIGAYPGAWPHSGGPNDAAM